jgi:UDP-N-acetylmuramoyl-tripeptide--D-alanyl-D-alanine ligase
LTEKLDLDSRLVSDALGLAPDSGAPERVFSGVCTDSRRMVPGSLFVALRGERFDANAHVEEAIAAGATGVICEPAAARRCAAAGLDASLFPVADTLAAFRQLAAAWRSGFERPVFAVGGSVGKTTTKEMLAAMLSTEGPVLRTEASQNGFVGIPMTLMRLRREHCAAVVEIGIDAPGAMARHVELVRPEFALVTAIAEEHLEQLGDLATVAREETRLLDMTLAAGGGVAVNLDDPWLADWHARQPADARVCTWSLAADSGASLWGDWDASSNRLAVHESDALQFDLPMPVPGGHSASNLLGAVALARLAGLAPARLAEGLARMEKVPGRSEIREVRGLRILADHYNANPASTRAALALAKDLAAREGGRLWLCLADMLELGDEQAALHAALAGSVIAAAPSGVFLTGPLMKSLDSALADTRLGSRTCHCATVEDVAARVRERASPGDWVLIKGSRSMRMERVLDALEAGRTASEAAQ